MIESDTHREKLKSLLDKWNTELSKLEKIQTGGSDALKELKQGLENSWTAFEQRFD